MDGKDSTSTDHGWALSPSFLLLLLLPLLLLLLLPSAPIFYLSCLDGEDSTLRRPWLDAATVSAHAVAVAVLCNLDG